MTIYQPADVVLVEFPFTDLTQGRRRPALIILDDGDGDLVVARIATRMYQTTHNVSVDDW